MTKSGDPPPPPSGSPMSAHVAAPSPATIAAAAAGGTPSALAPDDLPLTGLMGLGARIAPNLISFFSSSTIMVLELVAGRLVSNNVGSSQYTWTSIIGVILAGMSIGNMIGGRLADTFRPMRLLPVLFLFAAVLVLIPIPMNELVSVIRTPFMPSILENTGTVETGGAWRWGLSVLWMMTLVWIWPAIALGMIGPALAKLALDNNPSSGRAIGNVYTFGSIGMIIGTFLTGFVLVSFLPVTTIIWMVAGMMALLGLLVALVNAASRPLPAVVLAGTLIAIGVGGLLHNRYRVARDNADSKPATYRVSPDGRDGRSALRSATEVAR